MNTGSSSGGGDNVESTSTRNDGQFVTMMDLAPPPVISEATTDYLLQRQAVMVLDPLAYVKKETIPIQVSQCV